MITSKIRKRTKSIIQIALVVIIVGSGLAFAKYFTETKPSAKRSRPVRQAPLVDVVPVRLTSKTVIINAMGTVVPAREISLYSQLSGTVSWIAEGFTPGGRIIEGEKLVQLDKEDYELEVKKQQALVRQLQADLDLEKGKQEVARKEIELMKRTTGKTIKDPSLALRVPQMEKAVATLKSQLIGLEQAQLNLNRTLIVAPFNAMVLERDVELGSRITTQNVLARLIGTDAFWIEAAIPVDKLQWINIPGLNGLEASQVNVHLQNGSSAEGRVIRLLGDLNSRSQMARVLVQVDDPLGMDQRTGEMPLLVNSYVSMDVMGSRIENVVVIPRKTVKDGNLVWLLESEKLKIRSINPVWEDEDNYYLSQDVKSGELLITSELTAAVEGMSVRTQITTLAKNEKANALEAQAGDKKSGKGKQPESAKDPQ
ncbi:MAG: efflux RND transporter periplasmic adaptor subunit [Proteobacteria bacterium]|nr:efflux RND transporter periplasmic adaptor subunit [Pseudomonadota bacterium]